MKHYRIYVVITVIFGLLYILFSFISIRLISKNSSMLLLDNEIKAGRRRSEELSLISAKALEYQVKKDDLVQTIQQSIENVGMDNVFLSVVDWSGKIVCYPDITKVGSTAKQENAMIVKVKNEVSAKDLYQLITQADSDTQVSNKSAVIGLRPISNSDLIVATHLNLENINTKIDSFINSFLFIFIVLGLTILILILGVTRYLSNYYYDALEQRSLRLEDGMLNLSKLNMSLENYQKNMSLLKEKQSEVVTKEERQQSSMIKEVPKKRLLTYVRNELMPVAIEDISYIYVENTITFVVRKDGKRYTANDSLDQIYTSLDDKLFFRANRQIIVSIYAIDKIIKYGNSSLKIETQPTSEIDIVIGKNKASSFKQWLDM